MMIDVEAAVTSLLSRFGVDRNPPKRIVSELCALVARYCHAPPYTHGCPLTIHGNQIELPDEQRDGLQRLIEDIVLAYGVGWHRGVEKGGWSGVWLPALRAMEARVGRWLRKSDRWLLEIPVLGLDRVLQSREWTARSSDPSVNSEDQIDEALDRQNEGRDQVLLDVGEVTGWLVHGTCLCYRRRFSDPDAVLDNQARLMQERCHREHPLLRWEPDEVTLENRIANAIKGPLPKDRQGQFGAGEFNSGIYFTWLTTHHGLKFDNVMGWECPDCRKTVDGPRCGHCGRVWFDRTKHPVVKLRARLLLPRDRQGAYDSALFFRCAAPRKGESRCGNYYLADLGACPLAQCGWVRKNLTVIPTRLWMLTGLAEMIALGSPAEGDLEGELQDAALSPDESEPPPNWDEACEQFAKEHPAEAERVDAISTGLYGAGASRPTLDSIALYYYWDVEQLERIYEELLARAWALQWRQVSPTAQEQDLFRGQYGTVLSAESMALLRCLMKELERSVTGPVSVALAATLHEDARVAELLLRRFYAFVRKGRGKRAPLPG